MKPDLDVLRQQQQSILDQMQVIGRLRRGSLSCQFFPATKPRAARRGPYFLLQGSVDGKKFSERVPQDQAPQVQQDVDHYRRFQELTEEYVTVTDQLTRAQDTHLDSKKTAPPEVADAQFRETNAFLNLVRQAFARQGVLATGGPRHHLEPFLVTGISGGADLRLEVRRFRRRNG